MNSSYIFSVSYCSVPRSLGKLTSVVSLLVQITLITLNSHWKNSSKFLIKLTEPLQPACFVNAFFLLRLTNKAMTPHSKFLILKMRREILVSRKKPLETSTFTRVRVVGKKFLSRILD